MQLGPASAVGDNALAPLFLNKLQDLQVRSAGSRAYAV